MLVGGIVVAVMRVLGTLKTDGLFLVDIGDQAQQPDPEEP